MLTTRFRVWLQRGVDAAHLAPAVWVGINLVKPPKPFGIDAVDFTVVGDGSDLRRLIGERQDVFAALLQLERDDQ